MRRKRLVSLFLVVVLVLALVPASVFAEEKMVVDGTVDFLNPVFNVILPTDLNFKVDPFSVLDEGQIVSPGYGVVNRSPMAIQVSVNAAIQEASAGLWNVKTSAADVNLSDPTITTHDVYLTAQAANVAPVVNSSGFTYDGDPTHPANIASDQTLTWVTPLSNLVYASAGAVALSKATDNAFTFIVNKSGNTTVVTGSKIEYAAVPNFASDDSIAFKFAGAINPYADGLAQPRDQFKIIGTFTFAALTPEGYAAQAAKLVAGTHGFLGGAGGNGGGSVVNSVTIGSIPPANSPTWTVSSANAGSTISSAALFKADGTTQLVALPTTIISMSAGKVVMDKAAGIWTSANNYLQKGKTYQIKVTFANTKTETFTLVINN